MNKDAWTRSLVEEVIMVLWTIASIASFGFGFYLVGWICAAKALFDAQATIWFSIKEAKEEK